MSARTNRFLATALRLFSPAARESLFEQEYTTEDIDENLQYYDYGNDDLEWHFPYERYVPWRFLEEGPRNLAANILEYDAYSWDFPGNNNIEWLAYSSTEVSQQVAIDGLGIHEDVWDCYLNHYFGYEWLELEEYELDVYFIILGWNANSWSSENPAEWPLSEDTYWIDLSETERSAAERLCYFQQTWDMQDSLEEWWDIFPDRPSDKPEDLGNNDNSSKRNGNDNNPEMQPTLQPLPTKPPINFPTISPTSQPTHVPTYTPTTSAPSYVPTTLVPTQEPTDQPTPEPSTNSPSLTPSQSYPPSQSSRPSTVPSVSSAPSTLEEENEDDEDGSMLRSSSSSSSSSTISAELILAKKSMVQEEIPFAGCTKWRGLCDTGETCCTGRCRNSRCVLLFGS